MASRDQVLTSFEEGTAMHAPNSARFLWDAIVVETDPVTPVAIPRFDTPNLTYGQGTFHLIHGTMRLVFVRTDKPLTVVKTSDSRMNLEGMAAMRCWRNLSCTLWLSTTRKGQGITIRGQGKDVEWGERGLPQLEREQRKDMLASFVLQGSTATKDGRPTLPPGAGTRLSLANSPQIERAIIEESRIGWENVSELLEEPLRRLDPTKQRDLAHAVPKIVMEKADEAWGTNFSDISRTR